MQIDHTRAMLQRCNRIMPVVHMDIDRHITCKGCGLGMVVSSRQDAADKLAKVMAGITASQTATSEGKQGLGPYSK